MKILKGLGCWLQGLSTIRFRQNSMRLTVFTLETCVFTCTEFPSSSNESNVDNRAHSISTNICMYVSYLCLYFIHIYSCIYECVLPMNFPLFRSFAIFFGLHFICFPSSIRRTEIRRRISSYHPDGIKHMKCSHFSIHTTHHIE